MSRTSKKQKAQARAQAQALGFEDAPPTSAATPEEIAAAQQRLESSAANATGKEPSPEELPGVRDGSKRGRLFSRGSKPPKGRMKRQFMGLMSLLMGFALYFCISQLIEVSGLFAGDARAQAIVEFIVFLLVASAVIYYLAKAQAQKEPKE